MLTLEASKRWIEKNLARLWLMLGFAIVAIQGCSTLATKESVEDQKGELGAFRTTVAPASNPVPMPIEVATEIAQISAGQGRRTVPTILTPDSQVNPPNLAANEEPQERGPAATAQEVSSSSSDVKYVPVKNTKGGRKAVRSGKKKNITYEVKAGDTLMKISFEKYGDVYRWREIYDGNRHVIKNYNVLVPGTVLTIAGYEYVVIERNGEPYLIRRNDTLVKISKYLYGTTQEWKSLWLNNRQLIHDPNKIYSGFTLYYRPKK